MKGEFGEPWRLDQPETGGIYQILRDIGTGPGDCVVDFVDGPEGLRIVACVNALDGLDPEKLGAFLEACKEIVVLANKLVRGNYADMAHADWLGFIDAYDALTGEG